jgi:hypothetical protein
MAKYYLQNYGLHDGITKYNFGWGIISNLSSVMITASEGSEPFENGHIVGSTQSPKRFVGDALFKVHNVAPYEGGVHFTVEIDWPGPLNLWICITVLDSNDYAGMGFL